MKKWLNERGFTLIEMLVVLLVISIVLLVAIPNIAKHSESINKKGCEALIQMVQGQVEAYHIEKGEYPGDLDKLANEKYIKDKELKCPGGKPLTIDENGNVKEQTK